MTPASEGKGMGTTAVTESSAVTTGDQKPSLAESAAAIWPPADLTDEQLVAAKDHWHQKMLNAPGFASANESRKMHNAVVREGWKRGLNDWREIDLQYGRS